MYSLVVIDDEIELLEGLQNHFPWERYGFKVQQSFSSGKKALEWLKENAVDVVLTDICMPFLSGLELITHIKDISEKPPIFCLLSAHQDFSYAQKGIQLGVKHYLLKPTDFEEIGDAFLSIKKELDEQQPSTIEIQGKYSLHIQKALDFIVSKPDIASLQIVADDLCMNASYLSRLFKEETGTNFSTILLRVRMEKAAELLSTYFSYSNKEIAELLGYGDAQNFCRTFRKYFSMTPQAYRKERVNE